MGRYEGAPSSTEASTPRAHLEAEAAVPELPPLGLPLGLAYEGVRVRVRVRVRVSPLGLAYEAARLSQTPGLPMKLPAYPRVTYEAGRLTPGLPMKLAALLGDAPALPAEGWG